MPRFRVCGGGGGIGVSGVLGGVGNRGHSGGGGGDAVRVSDEEVRVLYGISSRDSEVLSGTDVVDGGAWDVLNAGWMSCSGACGTDDGSASSGGGV